MRTAFMCLVASAAIVLFAVAANAQPHANTHNGPTLRFVGEGEISYWDHADEEAVYGELQLHVPGSIFLAGAGVGLFSRWSGEGASGVALGLSLTLEAKPAEVLLRGLFDRQITPLQENILGIELRVSFPDWTIGPVVRVVTRVDAQALNPEQVGDRWESAMTTGARWRPHPHFALMALAGAGHGHDTWLTASLLAEVLAF